MLDKKLKTVYTIYISQDPDGEFEFATTHYGSYPSDEFLLDILDTSPKGFGFVSVEKAYYSAG